MKPRIHSTHELAKALGISRWTVSRALNGHGGLSQKTIASVLDAAKEHGFSPSILGRGLRQGRTKIIGVCVPDLVDYFLTDKVARLQKAVEEKGFNPLFQMNTGSLDSEKEALQRFASMRCAGIVIIASQMQKDDPILLNLAAAKIPVVRIDPFHEKSAGVVASDRAQAMEDVIEYFCRQGHRRISIFGIRNQTPFGRQRIEGIKAGINKWGLSYDRDLTWFDDGEHYDDFIGGTEMAKTWLKNSESRGTAILALNDRVALGAMRVLSLHGLKIPSDVSIVGYDNTDFSAYTDPSLSTIDPHVSELIDESIKLLFPAEDAVEGEPSEPALIRPTLVIRASSGKAPL